MEEITEKSGSYDEKVLCEIIAISKRDGESLFDACVTYCEESDIEVEELVEYLGKGAIEILRQSALENNKVRKKIATLAPSLSFE